MHEINTATKELLLLEKFIVNGYPIYVSTEHQFSFRREFPNAEYASSEVANILDFPDE